MKILLVYPQYPDTFWSFKHALKIIAKKASLPPLGLLTVAAMLPSEWEKKLVDMNVTPLTDDTVRWADYVFISAMVAQYDSVQEVIARCRRLGAKMVAGGPLFNAGQEAYPDVDHIVIGESEPIMPELVADLSNNCPKPVYRCDTRPVLTGTPPPLWSLLDKKKYSSMSLQYSRGCPFNCEFCDIIIMNGRVPRTKPAAQIVAEFDALYNSGWRGGIFMVDDNFIGNKNVLKSETLPAIIKWQKRRKYPFALSTEASINLADDEELMRMVVDAGFNRVFVGIETPNEESLAECSKSQNRNRDMVASVKLIQRHGLEVQGGFIVGFDSDPLSIFKTQINFIQKSGIVSAMVGMLNAPPGTRLYQRLKRENRLLKDFTGNNMDGSTNFIPKMGYDTLLEGYHQILRTIYSPHQYYDRIKEFLREFRPRVRLGVGKVETYQISAFFQSMWLFGIIQKGRRYYWNGFISTLFQYPRSFPTYIMLTVYGHHFRKTVEKYTGSPGRKTTA